MSSSFKFVLPLLLGTSPLLLAAKQPAANYTSLSCGLDAAAESSDATISDATLAATYTEPDVTAEVAARPIAHPIVTSLRVLVTSENEWSSFLNRAVAAATGYWRENPDYSMQFATEAANEIADRPECMAQSPVVKSTAVEGANKEEPGAGAAEPTGGVVDDIPVLEPATGEALPAQVVEPIGAETMTPVPQPTEPSAVEPQSPASTLVPAPPAVDPAAVPNVDPNNFTPDSQMATPFDGMVPDSLGNLPDGSYRYLQGRFENLPYSDDVLRTSGRSVFLLTKTGNEVVGRLMPQLGEAGVCIDGELNGDVVMGTAYSEVAIAANAAEVEAAEVDAAEKAATPFDNSALEVNGRVAVGEQTVAANVSLNLDEFSRINAGSAIAPTTCTAPEQPTAEATN